MKRKTSSAKPYSSVLFDLGGVVLDSPVHAIASFEARVGLTAGSVGAFIKSTGNSGAWAMLERGEIDFTTFCTAFENEGALAGITFSARQMMDDVEGAMRRRPQMLDAVRSLRESGFKVGALTNNWAFGERVEQDFSALSKHFDVFIESYKVGRRKPESEIYVLTCDAMDVSPQEVVFLDDLGANLKTARGLGMHTIKVNDPDQALIDLAVALRTKWSYP